jgi:hypothetical protein
MFVFGLGRAITVLLEKARIAETREVVNIILGIGNFAHR